MHGVRLVSTPPRKTAGCAWSGLERSGSKWEAVSGKRGARPTFRKESYALRNR
jgi:hypothetical protein